MQKHFLFKTYRLLSPLQRKRGVWIIMLLAFSSFLDFFSLAFFLPLIILLVDPASIQDNFIYQRLLQVAGPDSPTGIAVAFTAFIFVFIVVKSVINISISKRKAEYAYSICSDFASRAVSRYLSLPYLQFTQAQIANEVNIIGNLPLVIANNIIIPAATLFSESLVTTLLLITIALYDVRVFAFLLLVIAPAFLIYRVRRRKVKIISQRMRNAYSSLFSNTLKMVEGLPDIRAFGKERFFKEKFEESSRSIAGIFASDHSAQASIGRYTEIVAAWCICLLIIFTLVNNSGKMEVLLLIGIYTGASFRIIPSVNRILVSIQQMKIHESNGDEFYNVVSQPEHTAGKETITFNEKLTLKNLSFAYPESSDTLRNINLIIKKGEKVAITGKSGVGKTSILLILLRFLKEQEGEIHVDNNRLSDGNVSSWRQLIGYVPQNPYIIDGSIANNIAFGLPAQMIDEAKVIRLISEVDLTTWVNELPQGIHTSIGEKGAKISGGQRQRLAIARALYHDAQLLLLDEVTNQLDAVTEREVVDRLLALNDPGQTIIMITHHPDLLKRFDKVYALTNGVLTEKEQIAHAV